MVGPLLTKTVDPVPYKVPEKKTEKEAKKTRGGLRHRARRASEEDGEEEDESLAGGKKKITASSSLEADSPKRGKTPLQEESTGATDSSPEWAPRAKPLVNS